MSPSHLASQGLTEGGLSEKLQQTERALERVEAGLLRPLSSSE